MSTKYAIFRKDIIVPLTEHREILWEDVDYEDEQDYVVIGSTSCFLLPYRIIVQYLPDDIPIYAIDNSTKLKTLGDLKEYYKKFYQR